MRLIFKVKNWLTFIVLTESYLRLVLWISKVRWLHPQGSFLYHVFFNYSRWSVLGGVVKIKFFFCRRSCIFFWDSGFIFRGLLLRVYMLLWLHFILIIIDHDLLGVLACSYLDSGIRFRRSFFVSDYVLTHSWLIINILLSDAVDFWAHSSFFLWFIDAAMWNIIIRLHAIILE